jgi:flagellar protein FlaG
MEINKLQSRLVEPIRRISSETAAVSANAEHIAPATVEPNASSSDLSKKNLKDLADTLNVAAKSMNQRVSFSFNEKIDRVVMKVINTNSNEVVREIPPKEMVRVYEHIHELIGMFVDASR